MAEGHFWLANFFYCPTFKHRDISHTNMNLWILKKNKPQIQHIWPIFPHENQQSVKPGWQLSISEPCALPLITAPPGLLHFIISPI